MKRNFTRLCREQEGSPMKTLMLGNEAAARGLFEAGCSFVSSYPGTPSTEITECAAKYPEIYAEWAPNEKVAMEAAFEPVRPPQLLRHEACRPERRSRSPVHAVLHRRARRHGHRRGGRRGHALVSERAGFPSLCHRRKAADARAVRRRGVAGVRQAGLRALREVRYAGPAQDVHARRARAERSGDVRTAGGRPDPL